jgi:glyoxylase-like metal-dependent hydrolase (beta-lactamase superfamily II)
MPSGYLPGVAEAVAPCRARRTPGIARIVATLFAALGMAGPASAAAPAPTVVAPGVYALPGQGGEIGWTNAGSVANVAFVVGPRGVIVIDSGASRRQGDEIIAAVASVTRQPIRLLVLTHAAQEVVFGAAAFQTRGIPILMSRNAAALMAARCDGCLARLREVMGEDFMTGSRVVRPDRLVERTHTLDVIGRPLRIVVPADASPVGMLAVLDVTTRTLIAGNLVSIDRIPDLRDTGGAGWRDALALLAATRCAHLVPAYGRLGNCGDIAVLDGYFEALDERVRGLLHDGVGLAELTARCELPQFASWDRYPDLHMQNANRAYLRLERALFLN